MVEDGAVQHVRAAVAGDAHGGRGRVDPERGDAAIGECADVATWAAADVEHRPAARGAGRAGR